MVWLGGEPYPAGVPGFVGQVQLWSAATACGPVLFGLDHSQSSPRVLSISCRAREAGRVLPEVTAMIGERPREQDKRSSFEQTFEYNQECDQ
jgi:hypothetical protein